MTPRGPDRRQGPRRAEEATLHYAAAGLLQSALNAVSALNEFAGAEAEDLLEELAEVLDAVGSPDVLEDLTRAARTYREAEAQAHQTAGG